MTTWRMLPGERTKLYSPIGLRLIDEMTGQVPIGQVTSLLEFSDDVGVWRKTDVKAVITLSGVIAYPGLERRAEVVGRPSRRYRIRLNAEFYHPMNLASVEFDAYPYNDSNPPNSIVSQVQNAFLIPATNYPFPTYVTILRGVVKDALGKAVESVKVIHDHFDPNNNKHWVQRVLTDERGGYALPLRRVQKNVPVAIIAHDPRTGRVGSVNVTLPADLGKNHTIIIS